MPDGAITPKSKEPATGGFSDNTDPANLPPCDPLVMSPTMLETSLYSGYDGELDAGLLPLFSPHSSLSSVSPTTRALLSIPPCDDLMTTNSRVWSSFSAEPSDNENIDDRRADGDNGDGIKSGKGEEAESIRAEETSLPKDLSGGENRANAGGVTCGAAAAAVTSASADVTSTDAPDGVPLADVFTPIDSRHRPRQRPSSSCGGSSRQRSCSVDSEASWAQNQNSEPWYKGSAVNSSSSHAPPDNAGESTDALQAAPSSVSFQKPRKKTEVPRIKGPLGSSALRVTLGTPVEQIGRHSISRSVQAKLSLRRVPDRTITPGAPARRSSSSNHAGSDSGFPSNGGSRADDICARGSTAGAEHGGCGSDASSSAVTLSGADSSAAAEGLKEGTSGNTRAARLSAVVPPPGMFDAVSPPAATTNPRFSSPYSVCRVGGSEDNTTRKGGDEAAAGGFSSRKEEGEENRPELLLNNPSWRGDASQQQHTQEGAGGMSGGSVTGDDPLCRTPMKSVGGSGSGGGSGKAERWSELCATPPARAMQMGTPCSGSKFRSCKDEEESDYDDYDEVTLTFVYNSVH